MKKFMKMLTLICLMIFSLSGCKEYSLKSIRSKNLKESVVSSQNLEKNFLFLVDNFNDQSQKIQSLSDVADSQEKEIKALSEKVNQLTERFEENFRPKYNYWSASMINTGYQWAQCDKLTLTVNYVGTTKFLNGYKLNFEIGNPNFAALSGVKLDVVFAIENKQGIVVRTVAQSNEFTLAAGGVTYVEVNAQGIKKTDLSLFSTLVATENMKVAIG